MTQAVDNAIQSIAAVSGYEKSFTEFTVSLVKNVMDALVASSINQMKSYADLVSTLEKGLATFKSQVAGPGSVTDWITKNIPEITINNGAIGAGPFTLSQSSADILKNLYATKLPSIILLTNIPNAKQFVLPTDAQGITDMTAIKVGSKITQTQVGALPGTVKDNTLGADAATGNVIISLTDAVRTMLDNDAIQSYNQLDTLVKMGLLRIVITDGHILTKLSFQMETTDSSKLSSTDIYRSSFSAGGGGSASFLWFNIGASASYSNLKIKVTNENTSTSTDILATVTGEVLVNYKSDYFPALPSQAKP